MKNVGILIYLDSLEVIQVQSYCNLMRQYIFRLLHKSIRFFNHFLQCLILLRLCSLNCRHSMEVRWNWKYRFGNMGIFFHMCDNGLQCRILFNFGTLYRRIVWEFECRFDSFYFLHYILMDNEMILLLFYQFFWLIESLKQVQLDLDPIEVLN